MSISYGYTVIWVPDVEKTVAFYERAFGLTRRFIQTFGPITWGEMETGATALAFSSESEAQQLFADGFYPNRANEAPALILVSLVTEDVTEVYRRALEAGATKRDEPRQMPWGQTVARVRDLNGVLVSLATPAGR
ncbi:MAG: VOC family protein [Acidobacteriaceae bacterium]|nr:VOC family protein [Acidobacteriaceae bacterium]